MTDREVDSVEVPTASASEHALNRRHLLGWLSTTAFVMAAACSGGKGGAAADDSPSTPGGQTNDSSGNNAGDTNTSAGDDTGNSSTPATPTGSQTSISLFKYGVALTTLEGSPDSLPGQLGGSVFVTPDNHFSYYKSKGLDHIRLEGSWERLQPRLYGALGEQLLDSPGDQSDPLRNPVNLVNHDLDRAKANNLKVILDLCHNYGRRYIGYDGSWAGKTQVALGSAQLPIDAFADYCVKIVKAFGNHPAVAAIDLMNEPHDMPTGGTGWRQAAQAAITAIRKVNTKIPIMVEGYNWASAQVWPNVNPDLHTLSDPSHPIIWSAHLYFDSDGSGTYNNGTQVATSDQSIGVNRLAPFLAWLKEHGYSGYGHIGEFGAPDQTQWQNIVKNFLVSAKSNGIALTAHQDIPYLNDPYQMNLFPATSSSGAITGADHFIIKQFSAL